MVKALYMRTRGNVLVKFLDMNNLIKLQQKAQEKLEEYGINLRLPEKEFEYESFLFSPELDHDKYIEVSLERLRLKFECQVNLYEEEIGRIEDTLEKLIS